MRLFFSHILKTTLSLDGSIPVVKGFYIPVNIKHGNIFTTLLLTFSTVAGA